MSIVKDFIFTSYQFIQNKIFLKGVFKDSTVAFEAIISINSPNEEPNSESYLFLFFEDDSYTIRITISENIDTNGSCNFNEIYDRYIPPAIYCVLCGMIATNLN